MKVSEMLVKYMAVKLNIHSAETKRKIGEAHKGRKRTEEAKANMRHPHKQHPKRIQSLETRQKLKDIWRLRKLRKSA